MKSYTATGNVHKTIIYNLEEFFKLMQLLFQLFEIIPLPMQII